MVKQRFYPTARALPGSGYDFTIMSKPSHSRPDGALVRHRPAQDGARDQATSVRSQIAAAAARLIAVDGADYASAKRKAARQILGAAWSEAASSSYGSQPLPDNVQIEDALRCYNALYLSQTQPARLRHLRTVALQAMELLADYQPYLTGAVLNGTAGAHAEIHLHLFADSPKEVHIFLLNQRIEPDLSETPHFRGARYDDVETASFLWQGEAVHAALYQRDDLRAAPKARADGKAQRAGIAALRALLAAPDADAAATPAGNLPITR